MHVVVLGAGYAGCALIRRLESRLPAEVDITLIDERSTHLVAHLLHRTIRSPELDDRLAIPLEDICSRAEIRQETVRSIDADRRRVELTDSTLEYDFGAICLGARTAFHGLPGVAEHAIPFKRREHATTIRARFGRLAGEGGRAVVVGAGLSGIQVAGELGEWGREADGNPDVVLLEQADRVAPGFDVGLQSAIQEELDERGVIVQTGKAVEQADSSRIGLADGQKIEYDLLVWTGGIRGQDTFVGDRPPVRSTLRLDERTFCLGDAATVIDEDGTRVEPTAQAALGQAATAAKNIERLIEHVRGGESGFEPRLSRYRDATPVRVVSVGDGTAALVGSQVLRGRPARTVKTALGARHLGSVGDIRDALGYLSTEAV